MKNAKLSILLFLCALHVCGGEFHVSPSGSDVNGNGSASKPFASIRKALEASRANKESDVITLADGEYILSKPLMLDTRDDNLTIRAANRGKATVWGASPVTNWVQESNGFLSADFPDVKSGKRVFRSLVVNGKLAPMACFPSRTGTLNNLGGWKARVQSAVFGYWSQKPTTAELRTMPYKKGDLPPGLDTRNAEVRIYHMWNESYCEVASNDVEKGILYFKNNMICPAGGYGRTAYAVYNIREGMKEPGQWYLDRTLGKLFYWPKEGETAKNLKVYAPEMRHVVIVGGRTGKNIRTKGITLDGLVISGATIPCERAGFGGAQSPGALAVNAAEDCRFENLTIRATGGTGLTADDTLRTKILNCDITDCGSSGMKVYMTDSEVISNRITNVGQFYPSACSVTLGRKNVRFIRNIIKGAPYCGIILRGKDNLIAENHISKVMLVMHDGAAIYGNVCDTVVRDNVVMDVVENGKGYGASAYYCDEGSYNVLFENNLSVGVERPIHHHITRDIRVVNNKFISDGPMKISFAASADGVFAGNTLVMKGPLDVRNPAGITNWSGNVMYAPENPKDPSSPMTVSDGKPAVPRSLAQKPFAWDYVKTPPKPDGVSSSGEYSPRRVVAQSDDGCYIGGMPSAVSGSWDDRNLYVYVQVIHFREMKPSSGDVWGKDDGVRFTVNGVTFEGYAGGRVYRLEGGTRIPLANSYAGKGPTGMGASWVVECALPFETLGFVPGKGKRLEFNVVVYQSAYNEYRWYQSKAPVNVKGKIKVADEPLILLQKK